VAKQPQLVIVGSANDIKKIHNDYTPEELRPKLV
jgi:hypothetical protein